MAKFKVSSNPLLQVFFAAEAKPRLSKTSLNQDHDEQPSAVIT